MGAGGVNQNADKVIPETFWGYHVAFFSFTYKNVYQFTYTKHKALHNSKVHRSLQNCGFSLWNLPHVTHLAPRIWRRLEFFFANCRTSGIRWRWRGDIPFHPLYGARSTHSALIGEVMLVVTKKIGPDVVSFTHTHARAVHVYRTWQDSR
jgi:hypothetical protein